MNSLSAKNNDTNDKDKIIKMQDKKKKKKVKVNNFAQNDCNPVKPQSVTEFNSEKNEWIRTI